MTDEFAELDRKLTEANLAHARARKANAEDADSEEVGRQFEQTGAEADRLGELYLLARFAHEAREAGLYVDDSVFEVPVAVAGPVPAAADQKRWRLVEIPPDEPSAPRP